MNNNSEEYTSLAKMIMYYLGDRNISPSEQDKDFENQIHISSYYDSILQFWEA